MAKDKQDIKRDSLFTSIAEYKDEYLNLLILAIKECLPLIDNLVKNNEYFSRYFDFPTIKYLDNGLPRFGKTLMMNDGPIKYKSCFSKWFQEPKINEDNITAFNEFIAFIESVPDLLKRIYPQALVGEKFGSVIEKKAWLRHIIHEVIESYIHIYNSFVFEENNALTIAIPFVNFIFEKSLAIDIYIPILFLDCDIDDEMYITENVCIVKLTDNFHLSRSRIKSTNSTVNDAVLDSANYALKLTSWEVKNTEWEFNFGDALYKYKSYPTELIDNFFGVLRLVTSLKTG